MASNFSVPYHHQLEGLKHVKVVGKVNEGARRFEVNLQSSEGEILLHFNVRFDENCVVRNNTKSGHQWQKEQRDGGMPFHHGNPFTLELVAAGENDRVICFVNGVQFCEYQAEDPLGSANNLEINGDVHLEEVTAPESRGGRDVPIPGEGDLGPPVSLEPSEPEPTEPERQPEPNHPEPQPVEPEPTQPEPQPEPNQPEPVDPQHPDPTQPGVPSSQPEPREPQPEPVQPTQPTPGEPGHQDIPHPGEGMSVPYHRPLQELIKTNRMRVVGVPTSEKGFQINFKAANGEVLFQFNPRLDQNCVIRNATKDQVWPYEAEEREGPCPFQVGRQFALDFLLHGEIIRCFVDGNEYFRFNSRQSIQQVDNLEIVGDLQLNQVLIA